MPPLIWLRWLASVVTYCQLGRKANACGEGSAGCHPDGGSETPLSEAGTEMDVLDVYKSDNGVL